MNSSQRKMDLINIQGQFVTDPRISIYSYWLYPIDQHFFPLRFFLDGEFKFLLVSFYRIKN